MAQLRLIGAPELVGADGRTTALGGAKQRGVLSQLALVSPHGATVDQLVDAVWGDASPETARNTVQVYVSALRKAIRGHGADVVRAGDGYALRAGPLLVDVTMFNELVAVGRSALRANDPARAADVLTQALALWRGTPFGGLDGQPFVDPARAALETTFASARADLAQSLLRCGRYDDAARVAHELILAQAYNERGWALLAASQYHSGRQVDALATCRRVRTLLVDELGLDPGPELIELEQSIRSQALAAPPPAPSSHVEIELPALPALPDPFVGRDALVAEIVAGIRAGHRITTLAGLGGIGKTTVSLAVAHQLRVNGEAARWCEIETATDAATALELVCRSLGVDPGSDPVTALAALDPARCSVLVLDNVEQVEGLATELVRLLAYQGAPRLLLSSRRPLAMRREQVLLVPPLEVIDADGEPGPAVDLFLHRSRRVRAGVNPASAIDAATVVCELLDGIPLAIELAAGRTRVLTADQLVERITRRTVSLLDADSSGDLPNRQASLRAVLSATVGLLSDPARQLLHHIAACDGWVSLELLEVVAVPVVSDVVGGLDELASVDLVQLDPQGRARLRSPVREFVLGSDTETSALAAGRVLSEVLALVRRNAPLLSGGAATDALDQLSREHDTVSATLSRALDSGDHSVAAELVLSLNRYWLLTGRLTEARRAVDAARALPGHPREVGTRLAVLAGTFASYLSSPEGRDLLERALGEATQLNLPPDRLLVNGWCCLASVAAQQADVGAAKRFASQAAAAAAVSGDPVLISLARDVGGHVAAYAGDYEGALAANLAGIGDARVSGDRYALVNLLQNGADTLLRLGRPRDANLFVAEAFDLSGSLDANPLLLAYLLLVRGEIAGVVGEPAAARGYLTEALRLAHDRYPDQLVVADALSMLACLQDDHEVAARMWGATDALYGDHAIAARDRLMSSYVELRAESELALGTERGAALRALGAAEPHRLIADLLARSAKTPGVTDGGELRRPPP
ncbi:MAG: BTAD domain-containing putative transcriptional regulator [Nocardioidaceae bacterium]